MQKQPCEMSDEEYDNALNDFRASIKRDSDKTVVAYWNVGVMSARMGNPYNSKIMDVVEAELKFRSIPYKHGKRIKAK